MPTITVHDANDLPHEVELPPEPGRAAATASIPVVLSNEDLALFMPRLGTSVDLAFTGVSAETAAITGTRVRLVPRDANVRVRSGASPQTAVATDALLIANNEYYFSITSGHVIAAIRDAGVSGVLNVTVVS